jgi:hypothetical protein
MEGDGEEVVFYPKIAESLGLITSEKTTINTFFFVRGGSVIRSSSLL